MIHTVAAMLQAIQQREIRLMEADGIKHAPTIGEQYEGLTSSLVTKMLPMPLHLQVVNGFVEGLNDELSGQIDCMLVRGTGKPIVHTGAYKWPARNVLAVFEVKKTLFSEELSDAHDQLSEVLDQYWRYLASGPTEDYDITVSRYAYGQIIGEPPPSAEEVHQLPLNKARIYHHLVAEQAAPLRIVLGYGGYAFAGYAPFSIWLMRIAVHEALRRLRLRNRSQQLEDTEHDEEGSMNVVETSLDPEQRASLTELGHLLEEAVLDLPDQYRTVIMLRDIDELSTAETAAVLDLTEQNVKVRLHRGRAMMRARLFARVGANGKNAFPFMGSRCDRVVSGVFARLRGLSLGSPPMP